MNPWDLQVATEPKQVVAPPAAATYVASFSDAKNYVLRLQAHGSLPSGTDPPTDPPEGWLDHPGAEVVSQTPDLELGFQSSHVLIWFDMYCTWGEVSNS